MSVKRSKAISVRRLPNIQRMFAVKIEQKRASVRKNPRHAPRSATKKSRKASAGFLHPDSAAVGGVVRVSKISFYGTDFGI